MYAFFVIAIDNACISFLLFNPEAPEEDFFSLSL